MYRTCLKIVGPRVYQFAKFALLAATCATSAIAGDPRAHPPDTATETTQDTSQFATIERLKAAYPDFVTGAEGNDILFKDGTRLPIDDGSPPKSNAEWLEHPDIKDMFRYRYPEGEAASAPPVNADPGRARNEQFFEKMYGDCSKGDTQKTLQTIDWMPRSSHQKLKVTRVNAVAERLEAVSRELDALPARFKRFLVPSAGTFNCRPIAGTTSRSAHGYGIAIDIATGPSHYWRWAKSSRKGALRYRNRIPREIVDIFEKHGFIWGGRWYHYDTMHFEYRPELLAQKNAGGSRSNTGE